VRQSSGTDRDVVKTRLLDFFVMVGEAPEVTQARKDLTNALF
jgi:thioredoxin-like negative regulator of GroEL